MTVDSGRELAPGYTVISHLSRGESLDVYEVWSAERWCSCVAKVLRDEHQERERPRRRLITEGRLLAAFTHPHIVRAYETIEEPRVVLVLETLDGDTLEHLLSRRRPLSIDEVRCLAVQLSSALAYMHRYGYLHLDLKPANIISEAGRAKLIDLSLARAPGRVPRGLGTRRYLSPEQARGEEVSVASDVWGLGAVLYEALTRRAPFEAHNGGYDQIETRAAPVRALRRWVPRELAEIVDACLDPAPGARPLLWEVVDELDVT
jgi:eukaryotic-like serine/threonine-protein kinase